MKLFMPFYKVKPRKGIIPKTSLAFILFEVILVSHRVRFRFHDYEPSNGQNSLEIDCDSLGH